MAQYIEAVGRRKTATARVRIYPGTGEIVVNDAGVTAIYSTPYARTLETARPLANALGLAITETPIPNRNVAAYGDSIAARVRREGGVIVVVGHSNTMAVVI